MQQRAAHWHQTSDHQPQISVQRNKDQDVSHLVAILQADHG